MIGLLVVLAGCLIGVYLQPLIGLVVALLGVAMMFGWAPRF